jgi:hypothetical protein
VCEFTKKIHPQLAELHSLRNTDPRLAGRGRIGATAAVTPISACTSGQPIVGFIAKESIGPVIIVDLIGTTSTSNYIIIELTKGLIIVRATLDGVVGCAAAQYIITGKASDRVYSPKPLITSAPAVPTRVSSLLVPVMVVV